MSKTIKLYENSSYISKFNATVTDCIKVEEDDRFHGIYTYKAVLDKTAFYPEGGGQPSDRGSITLIHRSASTHHPALKNITV